MIDRTMIDAAVRQARAGLEADPDGRLHAYLRRRLWLAMGPRDPSPVTMTREHQCRALLALYSAEKILPIWTKRWPRRKGPPKLLQLAFEVVRAGAKPESVRSDADDMWTLAEDVQYETGPGPVVEVAFAISRAATVAYHDERFTEDDATNEAKDPLSDPYAWDAAYIAAEGYAMDAAAAPGELPACRSRFWQFYLDEALPKAIAEAQQLEK